MAFIDTVSEHQVKANGIHLCYFEWGSQHRNLRATLLFVHANGYHARLWDSIIRGLEGYHIIAIDLRGHGRSEKTPIDHWGIFGDDLSSVVVALDLHQIVGIGHSMGGHALTEAAARHEARFERLILIDPAIIAPDEYKKPSSSSSIASPELHPAAQRKDHFENPQAMFDRFKDREPFSLFTRDSLANYCEYGLLKSSDAQGYRLACPPVLEASVYMASRSNGKVFDSVRRLELPVLIMRAREPTAENPIQNYSVSPTWPALVNEFRFAREIHYPERTHFLPMEIPDEMARRIAEEIQVNSATSTPTT